jgi:hypothetical protein
MNSLPKQRYVEELLRLYGGLAQTPARPSRHDRQLAVDLYERQVPYERAEAALLLASARRLMRPARAPKLGPIRSLHYFLPVIEELGRPEISADYIRYLRRRITTLEQCGQLCLRKSSTA